MSNKLIVRPISWSIVNPDANSMAKSSLIFPAIEIFGYTIDNQTVYIKIPRKTTYILRFTEVIDTDIISHISDIFTPTYIKCSDLDPFILIIRTPQLSINTPIVTWIEAKQDPFGEIESFWESKEIGPYEWLEINSYTPIPGKFTSCDINIRTEEEFVHPYDDETPEIYPRIIFWTLSLSSNKIKEIFIVTVNRDETTEYNILVGDTCNNGKIMKVSNEKDALVNFFAIYNMFKPDREVYYDNDVGHLIDRIHVTNFEIPKVSKILSLVPLIQSTVFTSSLGNETRLRMKIPGTEAVELIHYYRRFYSCFRNYDFDFISKEFRRIPSDDNDDGKICTTSARLSEIWYDNNIQYEIEKVCNNLGISIDTLLHKDLTYVIDNTVFNIDAGSSVIKHRSDNYPTYLKEAAPGIYNDIYIYDYSEIYRKLLLESDDYISKILGNRLEGAPSKLLFTAFYSRYITRSTLIIKLKEFIDTILETNLIIAIETTTIYSVKPIKNSIFKLVDLIPCYAPVAKASYLLLNKNLELEARGVAPLSRPKFKLAYDLIRKYLLLSCQNNEVDVPIPELETLSIDNFIMNEKIGDITVLPDDSIKYQLAIQYGERITSWISVQYIMTINGPILLSERHDSDTIDYDYYRRELNTYIKELKNLKVYKL